MAARLITTTARGSFNAMRFQGILVTDGYAQLSSMLAKALSPAHVLFFAEPVHDASGATTDWYTEAEGPLRSFTELPPEERERAEHRIASLATDVHRLAEKLQAGQDASAAMRGSILELALRYPGPEHMYLAGDQPVLTNWGFGPGTQGAQPEDLMRLGLARSAPGPGQPASAAAAPHPAAAGAAPAAVALGAAVFPWWRLLWAFLLGLLLALALWYLAGLLFGPAACALWPAPVPGCAPVAPPVRQEPEHPEDHALVALMTAEQEKERSLRRQLEELRRQLEERARLCVRTPAPEASAPEPPGDEPEMREEKPEEPPSLAELLPTTPEPPPAPEPKPQPKPKPKPVEKPVEKPKKQARGEDLSIPESAKKNNDMSFLEGCWDSDSGLFAQNTGEPITVQYCFDANGRGSRTIQKSRSNDRCVGSVRAKFDALGALHIDADGAACGRGGGFVPQQVECTQGAGSANCYGQERGGRHNKWKATFRRS